MSYINEALKKAQKNKDANHIGYIRSIGKAGGLERFFDKKFVYITLVIILAILVLIYYRFEKKTDEKQRVSRLTVDLPVQDNSGLNSKLPDTGNLFHAEDVLKADENKEEIMNQREALYKEAVSFFEKGKLQEAEDIFKTILSRDPGHVNSLNDMGVLSMQNGKYEDAIRYLEKAVKLKPDYVNPYYNLACTYSILNETEKGMTYLNKAVEIDKNVKDWANKDPDLQNLKNYLRVNGTDSI